MGGVPCLLVPGACVPTHHHHHQFTFFLSPYLLILLFSPTPQINSSGAQPAVQADTCHQTPCSTLTYAAVTSEHGTPPTNAPTPTQLYSKQPLNPSFAIQLWSFPWLAAAFDTGKRVDAYNANYNEQNI